MTDENVGADAGENAANEAARENTQDAELEARAKRMGWRPKEEFRGDPNRWTDAQTFIERGETELPVLRERYRALDDRFANMQGELTNTRGELKDFRTRFDEVRGVLSEFRDRAARAEEVAYARARTDLEGRMADAMRQADESGYSRAKSELDALNKQERDAIRRGAEKAEKPEEKDAVAAQGTQGAQGQGGQDPVVMQWIEDNPWFKVDPGMAGYATAVFQQRRAQKPGLSVRDHLDEVRRDVLERFPEKFENKRRTEGSAVSRSSSPASQKKGGIPPFEQWPADAKAAYERAAKWMPNYTKDEYAKVYFAGGE